jgi:O-methyltransferase
MRGLKRLLRSTLGDTGFEIAKYNYSALRARGMRQYIRERGRLIQKPTLPADVEILADPAFQQSVREVANHTFLDTARLANLWLLCQLSNDQGNLIEVGTYKGGGSLHLSNCRPWSTIFVCDTFCGFGTLPVDRKLDERFLREDFADTSRPAVEALFAGKNRDFRIIEGYFPGSDADRLVERIAFAHIDVDIYQSSKETLEYLASRTVERSIFVLDDYHRRAEGVVRAAAEFISKHRDWFVFPVYPSQGVMFHKSWLNSVVALFWNVCGSVVPLQYLACEI